MKEVELFQHSNVHLILHLTLVNMRGPPFGRPSSDILSKINEENPEIDKHHARGENPT